MSVNQFMNACQSGRLATVRETVAVVGVNCQSVSGFTGLMRSIYYNHLPVFHYLLSLPDVNINIITNNGNTALHKAVGHNNAETVRTLVMRDDIDMTVKNKKGKTAKEYAAALKRRGLVLIIEAAEMAKKNKEEEIKAAGEEAHQELVRGVADLARSDDFSDFTIICRGQKIRCSRLVIAAMSKVESKFLWLLGL